MAQWGYGGGVKISDFRYRVTFPLTFPTALYNLTHVGGEYAGKTTSSVAYSTGTRSTSSAEVMSYNENINWIAIGI